jgi:hypothetical protein
MPVFEFQSEDGEIISVLVRNDEPDEARHTQTQNGKVYKRVYAAPLAAKDTQIRDASQSDFDRMVTDKNITVGDAWQIAKDLSDARAQKHGGVDPVKEKFYKDYEKKTGGKHIDVKKREAMEKAKRVMEAMGVDIKAV